MANKVLAIAETAVVFGSEVGDDVAWSTENISNNAGRQSAHYNRGTLGTARAVRHKYRFYSQFQATPTVGNPLWLYEKTSDGTHHDNDDGTGDVAVSAEDKLRNLTPLRPIVVDEAAADVEMVSHGITYLYWQYVAYVLWNEAGSAITNDGAETKLVLTPMPDEIQ